MKNSFYFSILFTFLLFPLLGSSQEVLTYNDSLLIGTWKGGYGFLSYKEYTLSIMGINKKGLYGTLQCNNTKYNVNIKRDINGLVYTSLKNNQGCEFEYKFNIILSLDGSSLYLSGKETPCKGSYNSLNLFKQENDQIKKVIEKSNITVKSFKFRDQNKNGVLENSEYGSLQVKILNGTGIVMGNIFLDIISGDSNSGVFYEKRQMLLKLDTGINTVYFSLHGEEIQEEKNIKLIVDVKKIVKINDKIEIWSKGIGYLTVPISQTNITNSFSNTGYNPDNLLGVWSMNSNNTIVNIDLNKIAISTKNNSNKKTIHSKYKHYKRYFPWTEKEIFIDFLELTESSTNFGEIFQEGCFTPFYLKLYTLNQGEANLRQSIRFEYVTAFEQAWITPQMLRLNNCNPNLELIKELNEMIIGKWRSEPDFAAIQFNSDHSLVHYDKINQTDIGFWFWSFEEINGKIEVYLWLDEGNTRGTLKFKLNSLTDKKRNLILETIDSKVIHKSYLVYDETIDIPKKIVGLRLDEIFLYGLIGSTIVNGISDSSPGSFDDVVKDVFSKDILTNPYASAISWIRLIKSN